MIKLKTLVDTLEKVDRDFDAFYNIKTNEVKLIANHNSIVYNEEELEEIVINNDYIIMPTSYDIHEYQIMTDFAYKVNNEKLLQALKEKGAFRRFKDQLFYYNIQKEYYDYLKERHVKIIKKWCEDNNISYNE